MIGTRPTLFLWFLSPKGAATVFWVSWCFGYPFIQHPFLFSIPSWDRLGNVTWHPTSDIAVQSWLIHWNIMTNETKVFVVSWSVEYIIELPFVIFLRMKQKSPFFFSSSDDFKHKKSEIKITSKMKIFVWLIVFASIWRSRVLMGSHMSIPSRTVKMHEEDHLLV